MSKRKATDDCSLFDCSDFNNPEKSSDFLHKSSYGFDQKTSLKKQKTSMLMNIIDSICSKQRVRSENPKACPGIKYVSFNVRLNGEPFHDFLVNDENKDDTSGGKTKDVTSGDKNPGSDDCDLSLSLSLPYYSNLSTVTSQSNRHKQNHPDSETNVCSVVSPSTSSCSETTTDIEAPIEAVPLRMFNPVIPPQQVDWTMKKVLTESDCNAQHRLMISKKLVEDNYISKLDELDRVEISSLNGLRVNVLDCDMGIQLKLSLKKWPSSKCYGLMDNWRRDFVYRRGLKPGDEVGLCWDEQHNNLLFSMLNRSSLMGC